jgi:hypothetical protein
LFPTHAIKLLLQYTTDSSLRCYVSKGIYLASIKCCLNAESCRKDAARRENGKLDREADVQDIFRYDENCDNGKKTHEHCFWCYHEGQPLIYAERDSDRKATKANTSRSLTICIHKNLTIEVLSTFPKMMKSRQSDTTFESIRG